MPALAAGRQQQLRRQPSLPARIPEEPALLRPFFLIMKLEPMNRPLLVASASPTVWSVSRQEVETAPASSMPPIAAATGLLVPPAFKLGVFHPLPGV